MWKKHVGDPNGGEGNIRAVLQSFPVNEFSFGDSKSHPHVGTVSLNDAEIVLKSPDIRTYKVQVNRNGEVVEI